MNIPFRALSKILRQLGRWDELVLGIEHVATLGYSVHYVVVPIVGGCKDFDFVQRELRGGDVVESVFLSLLDLVFQFVH